MPLIFLYGCITLRKTETLYCLMISFLVWTPYRTDRVCDIHFREHHPYVTSIYVINLTNRHLFYYVGRSYFLPRLNTPGPGATKLFLCWANFFLLKSVSSANQIWVLPYLRIFSDFSKFSSFVAPGPDIFFPTQLHVFKNMLRHEKSTLGRFNWFEWGFHTCHNQCVLM